MEELELVKVIGDNVFTDSWIIAQGTGNAHRSIVKMINKYSDKLKKMGELSCHLKWSDNSMKNEIEVYQLNEPQASFLMTLLGNSDIVVEFKFRLVEQFYAMRQYILEQRASRMESPESKQRALTRDDYIKAASIIAGCRNERLPYVKNLLEQAGILIPDAALEQPSVVEPSAEEAYQYLVNWIDSNKDHFKENSPKIYGKIVRNTCLIRQEVLMDVLKQHNCDFDRVKKQWARAGYLIKNSQNKYQHYTTIYGKIKEQLIKLILPF